MINKVLFPFAYARTNATISSAILLSRIKLGRRRSEGRSIDRASEMSLLLSFLFPPPPSIFVTAMSVISFASLTNAGLSEVKGKHLPYSKFRDTAAAKKVFISGRTGMLVAYLPALVAGLASFAIAGAAAGPRPLLVNTAWTVHFFKRVFEVLFIHQYSGQVALGSAIPISLSYLINTVTMIYAQYLTRDMAEPLVDFKYAGVVLFFVGIAGNFYHHYLLSKLREKGDKTYKIPKGGLFGLVICPHYLFEIIGFVGIAFISQTACAFCYALGTMFYLMGRSYATRKWYLSKFENFPLEVKALVPYIF